jgi:hypothetical protein
MSNKTLGFILQLKRGAAGMAMVAERRAGMAFFEFCRGGKGADDIAQAALQREKITGTTTVSAKTNASQCRSSRAARRFGWEDG